MLQLQIGFPGGRYHAADIADPRQPEWPPHPSRVYSALVAAAYAGGRAPSDQERAALRFIESATPPALRFPEADIRASAEVYVPVNDDTTRLDAKLVNGKLKSHGVLHPNRQVRRFPCAFLLGEPEIGLSWPIELDGPLLCALDGLAERVTHVGTSHSFAVARFCQAGDAPPPTLVPNRHGGRHLRVPQRGRLEELDRLAAQGHGTLRRPSPTCEAVQPYAAVGQRGDAALASSYDWVSLRVAEASWGADTAHTMARALRAAVMSVLGDAAPAAVHGHDAGIAHVAWLPLPDVGHRFARGRIRGFAVALPLSMPAEERAVTLAALARLQAVWLPDGQVAQVAPVIDGPDTAVVLRTGTWCEASTHWSTVTPVLLDRPPKKSEPERVLAALSETVVNAGFPEPIALRATVASDFTGAPGVHDIPAHVPRVHARVVFAQPVCGPVIAGRWRNFGIGLFRPTPLEFQS